jgi:prepilin-type N-terminal cleavage/methylation domain-containing protein
MNLFPRNANGFTLLELMVAVSVGGVVVILAAGLLKTSSDRYGWVGGNIAVEREARAAMDQLTTDLATGQFHPQQVMTIDVAAWPKDRLGFLTQKTADAQTENLWLGDLCAVHYYLKDCQTNGQLVRCLMRGFRASSDSFKALYAADLAGLFIDKPEDEPIAFGVISFSARPRKMELAGVWRDWVSDDLVSPEAFEIRLVLLRREFWGQLLTEADWDRNPAVLGDPAVVLENPKLKLYEAKITFGNDALN